MSNIKGFLKSKKKLAFLVLLLTLGLGMLIGPIVSHGVFRAEPKEVAHLKIQGEKIPATLDKEVNLTEGFAQVAKTVEPTVVNISTSTVIETPQRRGGGSNQDRFRDFFGDDFFERFFGPMDPRGGQKQTSLGSGVIVDDKGYILTNYHVVAPMARRDTRLIADKISVRLHNAKTHDAWVVGQDPESDLAVLKIDVSYNLPHIKIGDASKLQVGDWVLAVGSPFGFAQTVTAGIVSATHRVVNTKSFGDYIQTDAAINPGNSGGPLVNMKGELVGLNTFISTTVGQSSGVGFAIPSSVFVNSYNQIVTKGQVVRGWLGIAMNHPYPMTPEMAKYFGVAGNDPEGIKDGDGVIVTQVLDEKGDPAETGPAYKAGIRAKDVIVKFGNDEIEDVFDLRSVVANTPPGKTVPVVVLRQGKVLHLNATLEERTLEQQRRTENKSLSFEEQQEQTRPKEIGLEFKTLERRDLERLGLKDEQGVIVLEVRPGSLADEAGLFSNQIITHVNGDAIRNAQEFKDRIDSMASSKGIILQLVTVNRDRRKNISFTSFIKP